MSPGAIAVVLASAASAALPAAVLGRAAIASAPPRLVRVNVSGREVPAVLGLALTVSALAVLLVRFAVLQLGGVSAQGLAPGRFDVAVAVLVGVMGAAGLFDDLRGSEQASGFAGHLRAAAAGRLTGGAVKIAAGAVSGMAGAAIVADGRAVLEIALCCALGANLLNLTDRAPGRAGKVALFVGLPLLSFGAAPWAGAAAAPLGALVGVLPADLRERGMLGDAGSNPVGAVVGLGIGVSLTEPWRLAALAALAVLNLASERHSFSEVIERRPWLHRLDSLGRRHPAK